MTVNLPRTNQTGKNEWADVESNDVALKEAIEAVQTEVKAATKPTIEEKKQASNLTLTEAFVLVPSLKYEVTPSVASKLIVDFTVVPQPTNASSFIRWDLYKNGVAYLGSGNELFFQVPPGATSGGYIPIHHTLALSLAAEANTIEIKARYEGTGGVMNKRVGGMVTQLYAA